MNIQEGEWTREKQLALTAWLIATKPEIREPDFSRASAKFMAEHYGFEGDICAALALDNALEGIDPDLEIVEGFYELANENYRLKRPGSTMYQYIEMIGGRVTGWQLHSFEFQKELERGNPGRFLKELLVEYMRGVNKRHSLCVLRLSNSRENTGHIVLIKTGLDDDTSVYFYDVVHYLGEENPCYGHIEISDDGDMQDYYRKKWEEFDGLEIIEFTLPVDSEYYKRASGEGRSR